MISTRRTIIRAAVAAALLAACITLPQGCRFSIEKALENVSMVPSFSVTLSNGQTYNLLTLYGTSAVIATFNAEGESVKALSVLQDAYDEAGSKARFILIADSLDEDEVESLWNRNGFTMPYAAQDDGTLAAKFSDTVPYLCVTNSDIRIQAEYSGKDMPSSGELIDAIEAAAN